MNQFKDVFLGKEKRSYIISSTTNVTFAGSSVNTDGTFTPGTITLQPVNKKSFTVAVPAFSAAVITIR